jgi:hypothetical protein
MIGISEEQIREIDDSVKIMRKYLYLSYECLDDIYRKIFHECSRRYAEAQQRILGFELQQREIYFMRKIDEILEAGDKQDRDLEKKLMDEASFFQGLFLFAVPLATFPLKREKLQRLRGMRFNLELLGDLFPSN